MSLFRGVLAQFRARWSRRDHLSAVFRHGLAVAVVLAAAAPARAAESCRRVFIIDAPYRTLLADYVSKYSLQAQRLRDVLAPEKDLPLETMGYATRPFELQTPQGLIQGRSIDTAPPALNRVIQNLRRRGYTVAYDHEFQKIMGAAMISDVGVKVLMIDRVSLQIGRPSLALLHELKHLGRGRKVGVRAVLDSFQLRLKADGPRLADFEYYRENMSFQEIATHLQDLRWLVSNAMHSLRDTHRQNLLSEMTGKAKVVRAGLIRYTEFFEHIPDLGNFLSHASLVEHKSNGVLEMRTNDASVQWVRLGEHDYFSIDRHDQEKGTLMVTLKVDLNLNPRLGRDRMVDFITEVAQIQKAAPLLDGQIPVAEALIAKLEKLDPELLTRRSTADDIISTTRDLALRIREIERLAERLPAP